MTYDIRYQSKEERRDHSGISRVSFGSKRSSNVRKIYLWCGCPPEKKKMFCSMYWPYCGTALKRRRNLPYESSKLRKCSLRSGMQSKAHARIHDALL